MKEATQLHHLHHRPHHHQHRFRKIFAAFTKPTAYFILILFCYTLGYLSAPSPSSSSPSSSASFPPTKLSTQQQEINLFTTTSISTDDHNLFSTVCAADPIPPELVRQTIIDRVFNGTSPWDNFPPPHVSKLLSPRKIKGWGSTGAVFENLIRKVQPKTIIEVGTFLGASALHMAELTPQLGLQDTQILCVDDFRGWPGFQDRFKDIKTVNGDVMLLYQFMQNVVQANATETVVMVPSSTGSALEKLCEWGIYGDLIEVDAGHDFHSAWSDINRAYKILRKPGGVLFGHDYFTAADRKGVRRAVNLFARLHNLRVQPHGQHWVLYPDNN